MILQQDIIGAEVAEHAKLLMCGSCLLMDAKSKQALGSVRPQFLPPIGAALSILEPDGSTPAVPTKYRVTGYLFRASMQAIEDFVQSPDPSLSCLTIIYVEPAVGA